MEGYGPSTYGDAFADVYDDWYSDLGDATSTADVIDALAAGGPVLELGVGTGRLAVPLAQRGVPTVGLDASAAMLARLARAAESSSMNVPAVRADMAAIPLRAGSFAVVFAAYNTLFNLPDRRSVERCFAEVARALRPGGVFVVESIVAAYGSGRHSDVSVHSIGVDRVVLTASVLDTTDQTILGQHIEIRESGVRMRPWRLHYLPLDQLDGVARQHGFEIDARWAGWNRAPFTDDASQHVSFYRVQG